MSILYYLLHLWRASEWILVRGQLMNLIKFIGITRLATTVALVIIKI